MELYDIISAFETAEENQVPLVAIREAIVQKEAITPLLLKALDDCAEAHSRGVLQEGDWRLPNFAAFLLASFGEVAAHEKIIRLFSMDEEDCEWLWGDELLDTGSRLLLSTYPGSPEALQKLVEDVAMSSPARGVALDALSGAAQRGMWSVECLTAYITSLFRGRIEREPMFLWELLTWLAAELGMVELEDDIKAVYDEELCDAFGSEEQQVLALLHGKLPWPEYSPPEVPQLITDVELEISEWGHFNQEETGDESMGDLLAHYAQIMGQLPPSPEIFLVARTEPKIGRNEPCPCGSGKKYKKCCINRPQTCEK